MIAFVISTPEITVVESLLAEGKPHMAGSLFYFTRAQIGPYLNDLANFAAATEDTELRNASMRLAERIGSWLGKEAVEAKVEAHSPAPVKKGRKNSPPISMGFHTGGIATLKENEVPVVLTAEYVVPHSVADAMSADD